MMSYIPLIEHARPRILMLDFPQQDVAKVQKLGYEARRGATGFFDRDEFYFPYAVHDVEIVFTQVHSGSFSVEGRTPATGSVEERPFFKDLVRETWEKAGWIVLFVAQDIKPSELAAIGLDSLGVISYDHEFMAASAKDTFLKVVNEYHRIHFQELFTLPDSQLPRYKGQSVILVEEPEAPVIQRFIKSAKMSIFTCNRLPLPYSDYKHEIQPHIEVLGVPTPITDIITDNSANTHVMAFKLTKSVLVRQEARQELIYKHGYILILPDFGENNGNVAQALLQEIIPQQSPHLFDTPQHAWLEKYQPAPVVTLLTERDGVVETALQKIRDLEAQAEAKREELAWLSRLLVATGDQFAIDAAKALRFLGFDVEEVDDSIAPSERKREDFRIRDEEFAYFALGEAKTTGKGRGAQEDFISKTQTHQNRYGREHHIPSPPALLLVNYAIDLDPAQRAGRFYQPEVGDRLEDNGITAISSVALFELCQMVFEEKITKEQARRFLRSGRPLIVTLSAEVVIATAESQS